MHCFLSQQILHPLSCSSQSVCSAIFYYSLHLKQLFAFAIENFKVCKAQSEAEMGQWVKHYFP